MEQLLYLRKHQRYMVSLVRSIQTSPRRTCRGVARGGGGSWGARDPRLVGLLLSKQPTIFGWRKRHDNILTVKAIVEKPTFLKFVFL